MSTLVLPRLGPPVQNGYVVRDVNRALDHWTRVMGVGPFFLIENPQFSELWYAGRPTKVEFTMALAQWGDTQIELIHQTNDAESPYRDFTRAGHLGLHHLAVLSSSLEQDLDAMCPFGVERIYWGATDAGFRFAYINSDAHPGAMIELIEIGPAATALFAMVKAAARDWDGRDPVRRLG
jgi:catechol 2,3-dioxygenase-like lactoylglutathione lyase family enzyme